jgi:uncharacterized cupin superfamily protein
VRARKGENVPSGRVGHARLAAGGVPPVSLRSLAKVHTPSLYWEGMSYHVVDIDSLEPHPDHESDRRTLRNALDLEHVGASLYTAAPGEQVPQRYHYHDTQEELFYVIAGEMRVETPDGELRVGANELFFPEPGSPHRAFNAADAAQSLRVIVIGAPLVSDGHEYDPDDAGD